MPLFAGVALKESIMTHVVDAGGRWHWIDKEYEKIAVGDKFVLRDASRWASQTQYSKPMPVSRTTDLTFWLMNEDGKEIRIARTSGKVHGSHSRYAKRLTDKLKKHIKSEKQRKKAEDRKKKSEADALEQAKREKYGATFIESEAVQDVLRPIRDSAEAYNTKLEEIFREIGHADAEDPRGLTRYLEWNEDRAGNISKYEQLRGLFTRLHDDMVDMVRRWNKGSAYTLKRPGSPEYVFCQTNARSVSTPEMELVRLLNSKVLTTLDEQISTFFNGHNQDYDWRYQFIKEMRWDYSRIELVIPDSD
jgi:hypothetical protein